MRRYVISFMYVVANVKFRKSIDKNELFHDSWSSLSDVYGSATNFIFLLLFFFCLTLAPFFTAAVEMLIVADKDGGHVILHSLDGASTEDYNILATSTMPVAVTYDPVERYVRNFY